MFLKSKMKSTRDSKSGDLPTKIWCRRQRQLAVESGSSGDGGRRMSSFFLLGCCCLSSLAAPSPFLSLFSLLFFLFFSFSSLFFFLFLSKIFQHKSHKWHISHPFPLFVTYLKASVQKCAPFKAINSASLLLWLPRYAFPTISSFNQKA